MDEITNLQPIITPSAPTTPRDIVMPDSVLPKTDTEAYQNRFTHFSESEQAECKLFLQGVKTYEQYIAECHQKAQKNIEDTNQRIDEYNQRVQESIQNYREMTAQTLPPLEENLKIAKQHQQTIAAELAVTQAKAPRIPEIPSVEDLEQKHAAGSIKEITAFDNWVEWVGRVILGCVLGLSIGLLMGAMNVHTILSPTLFLFGGVGLVILILNGQVIKWLAEEASIEGILTPYVHRWRILLPIVFLFFTAVDATVAMFGIFKALAAEIWFGKEGKGLTLPLLLLCCLIFIVPYLLLESSMGRKEGKKKAIRTKAEEESEEQKRKVAEKEYTPAEKEQLAEVARLKAAFDAATGTVKLILDKIEDIKRKEPRFIPPPGFQVEEVTGPPPEADGIPTPLPHRLGRVTEPSQYYKDQIEKAEAQLHEAKKKLEEAITRAQTSARNRSLIP